jgi:hypothetical protein
MEIKRVGDTLILSGQIVGDELDQVRTNLQGPQKVQMVVLRNSNGGRTQTAIQLGKLIRDAEINTTVSGYCLSSCSLIFIGGKERSFTDDFALKSTMVSFHGTYTNGQLDKKAVTDLDLFNLTTRFLDGKADGELIRRWLNYEKNVGAVYFVPNEAKFAEGASSFACNGAETKKPSACEKLATSAIAQGIVTSESLVSSPDKSTLASAVPPIRLPADLTVIAPADSAPAFVKAFSGKWYGKWDEDSDHVLVVEDIATADKVSVLSVPSGTVTGYARFTGSIVGDTLAFKVRNGAALVKYKLNSDGTLSASFEMGTKTLLTKMEKFN